MIDLHTHTNFSDGMQTLEQLLNKAENSKLKYLSITDHDSIDSYLELKKSKNDIFNGELITGTELHFLQDEMYNELLGYKFNVDKISKSFMFDKAKKQEQQLEFLYELYPKLIKKGFKLLSMDEYIEKILSTTTFAVTECGSTIFNDENKEIREKHGIFTNSDYKAKWIHNKDSDMYVNVLKYYPNMKIVSDTIRDAGGLVFMAHVFRNEGRNAKNDGKYLLDYAVKNKLIDGVEVYYKNHTKEQVNYLLDFCNEHSLYICGGTDSHILQEELGIIDTGIIPVNIIDNWIN